jgi:hypothetical protein
LTGRAVCVYSPVGKFMGTKQPSRGSWAVLSAAAALMLAGSALRADLAATSPFLPANVAAAGAANSPAGPIELRGISSTSDGTAFCIYDTAKKKDTWVGLNETGYDFVVKSSDPASDSISVQYQGRTMKLTLRTSKVASSGVASQAIVTPNMVGPPAELNPTPADEQRRLDAVAQEVRRRKLEREKAVLNAQNGANQPPAPNR